VAVNGTLRTQQLRAGALLFTYAGTDTWWQSRSRECLGLQAPLAAGLAQRLDRGLLDVGDSAFHSRTRGYPSKSNRAWLRARRIPATIPERDSQIARRRKKPGKPIEFGDDQKENATSTATSRRPAPNRLKQWRGIAMRSDRFARICRAALRLAATLIWIKTDLINTA